jgi:hypothetical protein
MLCVTSKAKRDEDISISVENSSTSFKPVKFVDRDA